MVQEGQVAHNVYSTDHREDFLWSPSALERFYRIHTEKGLWCMDHRR